MPEELRELYLRYVTAANARDFEAIAGLMHDDVTVNGVMCKQEAVLASLSGFVDTVPDFTWHVEDLVIAQDRIAARLRDTGTPAKQWLGVDPTNAQFEITEFANYKVRNGRFVDMWFLMDTASAIQQLRQPSTPARQ